MACVEENGSECTMGREWSLELIEHPRLCAQEPHLLGLQSQLCTTSAAWPRGSHSIFLETAFPYLSEGIFIALS